MRGKILKHDSFFEEFPNIEIIEDLNNWDEYFLNILTPIAQKSKDRSTKVSSIITKENSIISTGFNGYPAKIIDDNNNCRNNLHKKWFLYHEGKLYDYNLCKKKYFKKINEENVKKCVLNFMTHRTGNRDVKLLFTEHAEKNAINNAAKHGLSTKDSTIYVSAFPCSDCTKSIIQSGIIRIVTHAPTFDFFERWNSAIINSCIMLYEADIQVSLKK